MIVESFLARGVSTRGPRPLAQSSIIYACPETGGLFRIAVKLMMACSTTNSDMCAVFLIRLFFPLHAYPIFFFYSNYVPLVNIFGIYFQIRDDYMNLQSTQVRAISLSLAPFVALLFAAMIPFD